MSMHVVRRLAVTVTGAALLATVGSLLHAQAVPVNNPPAAPRSILVFPQRDFVSSSGFEAGDLVTVEVIHANGQIASTAPNIVPQDDPATPDFDGIVEVNHPGGACWQTVTPDIRFGDRVRTTRRNSAGTILGIDETTVANVTAKRPVQTAFDTVEIHGTAKNADGTPIDITQLEQRLVAPRDAFDLNGRRTLRATAVAGANDGLMTYDVVGGTAWTATYRGLDAADVTRALGAESRVMWLGNPAGTAEATVYEIGAGIVPGPGAPCAAPLEVLPPPPGSELVPPSNPTNVLASITGTNTVSLSWTASTDNVGVTSYGIYRNGVAIANVSNADGVAPAPTTYEDFNVPPGSYVYTVDAADEVGNRSARVGTTPALIVTTQQTATDFPLCVGTPDATCVSEPPSAMPEQVQIIAFPARDFTSSSGYLVTDASVTVQVIRNGFVISTANVIPVDDPTTPLFDGIVEVNHPGGGCWMGTTPDIRTGDVIRQIAYQADSTIRRVDQTRVANISVQRPQVIHAATPGVNDGVVEVHGTAIGATGSALPLGNITVRLVATRDLFDINGRRTIRAGLGEDYELSFDTVNNADGIRFTATFSGLGANDVSRAVGGVSPVTGINFPGADSRVIWLDDPTAVAPGMTIYENSDLTISGPAAAACFAAMEPLDTNPPSTPAPTVAQTGANAVTLTWSPSTDDSYVIGYGIYRRDDDTGGPFVRLRNVSAALATGATTLSFVDLNVPAGNHTYAVDAVDSASPLKVNYPNAFAGPNTTDPILQGVEWGNRSGLGLANPLRQGDVLAPSTPANLVATVHVGTTGPDTVVLTWSASTDDVLVTNYRVYRTTTNPPATVTFDVNGSPAAATFTDTMPAVSANTTFVYRVDAADAAANRSPQSASASAVITPRVDNNAPTSPANFAASTRDVYATPAAPAIGAHDVKLTWTAATDNIGVTSYGIYRRAAASLTAPAAPAAFIKIGDVNGSTLTYTDLNIATGTYDYAVDAADSAGNRSAANQRPTVSDVQTVDDPPLGHHSIIPFPQRDFVSSTGYAVSEGPIVITLVRGGKLWARSTAIDVVEDPATPGLGAAEVNHPGGGCWDTAKLNNLDGITPDLRPGDIVRFTNKAGKSDQTTVPNLYADRATDRNLDGSFLAAGTVQTHGTALDPAGNRLAVAAIESRLVASSADPFDVNARRVLRAGGGGTDGTLVYDPVGPGNLNGANWTATFAGLDAADIERAKTSESRAVWLGRDPLALTELTIFENGDGVVGGPAGPACTAPAEAGPAVAFQEAAPFVASFDPSALTVGFPTLNTGTSTSQTLTLTNVGSADSARAITGVLSIASTGIEAPGDFQLTASTCGTTVTLGNSCNVTIRFSPTAGGVRTARLVFKDNANNNPVQVFALSGAGQDAQAPVVTAPVQTFVTPSPMNVPGNALSVTVSSTATDSSGVASMQLEVSNDGGHNWGVIKTSTSGLVTTTLTFNVGGVYQFRATATDTLGNVSAPVASAAFHVSVSDDNSGTPKFSGSWSTQRNNAASAGAFGNTIHQATAPQAGKTNTVTFTFTGTEVALLAGLGPDRGQVTMSVDGGAARLVDLYAASTQVATVASSISGLTAGAHTVTVNVLTTRNALSTGTRIDVDAFIVKF